MSSSHDEFKELQRKYQYLEQNRKDYAKESAQTIAKQQKLVDKLKKDNEYLKNEYRNQMRKPRDSSNQAKLMELHDQVDSFTSRINLEKKTFSELSKQTKLMKRKILQVRKDMGGINAARENQKMVQKQINILENRLDKALVKFNNALAENKQLRKKIDNLRRERVVFDNIYRKLEKELHEKKMNMAEIIEASNQAYECRDKAHVEMAGIRKQNEREQDKHDATVRELDQLHDDMKDRTRAGGQGEGGNRGNMSLTEEQTLKSAVTKSNWVVVKDRASLGLSKEKVENYEKAFDQIKQSVGITDIDELVKRFISSEDQNFSLFNYVNGQAHEIEKNEEQLAELRRDETKYVATDGEDADQHQLLQTELQEKLDHTNGTAGKYEHKFLNAMRTLASLKIGIQNIFTKAGCDKATMSEMLHGERLQVTEANMMQFLGMIEQRTNEILQLHAVTNKPTLSRVEDSGSQAVMGVIGQGPSHPMGEQKIQIAPPTMDDYEDQNSDDDDADNVQMPHNLDQIKSEVMKFMSQRSERSSPIHQNHRNSLGSRSQHSPSYGAPQGATDARPSHGRRGRFRRAF